LVLDNHLQIIETISNPGMALGIEDNIELDAQTVVIPAGGLLIIYSDGLSEAQDTAENQFGIEGLAKELSTIGYLPAAQICSQLWKRVQEFVGEQPQSDDFTVIVIKRSEVVR
jgi:sigma-B regulation protein RsbU (phosphoserine phosphatase)